MRITTPPVGEGDVNTGARRAAWQRRLGASTHELLARDSAAFCHQSLSTPCLDVVQKAKGAWLEDPDGRRFLDFHGNNVHHVGHGNDHVIAAITDQLGKLSFAPRRFACEPAIALAEKLASIAPAGLDKVLFVPGGSQAMELALAYARAATGRWKTISFWDAFHGAGFGARSIGGEAMFRSGPIGPLLTGAQLVPPFGDYRNAWGVREGSAELCARQIEYVLEREQDVCAVIAEPMRAVPYVPPLDFWKKVRAACDKHGALLVFDEIPTGLGKTGRMFACEHFDVAPDVLVLGKSLGGGILPIAAMLCRAELDVAATHAFGHYTHEKNPVTARAALATIEYIEAHDLVAHAARMGELALGLLGEMQARHPLIGDVRGKGLLFGAELVLDRQSREPARDATEAVLYEALDRGLSFKTTMGNVLTFTPPLIVSEDEMRSAMRVIDESLAVVERQLGLA